VAAARHKQVSEQAPRRRLARIAVPVSAATLATGAVVGVAISTGADQAQGSAVVEAKAATSTVTVAPRDPVFLRDRDREFSRSARRVTLKEKPEVTGRMYRTANLNLWVAPAERGKPLRILEEGGRVAVTGVRKAGFAQILYDGQVRWVKAAYLSKTKPVPPKPAKAPASSDSPSSSGTSSERSSGTSSDAAPGTSSAAPSSGGLSSVPCADGSGTESGLTSSAVRLFRAACAAFPALSSYGGLDAHGEHSTGKAIDFMTSDPALGQALADWARAHAGELDLFDVIWAQRIWTPARSGEGWRSMSDRGSATANHYDHVHIAVN